MPQKVPPGPFTSEFEGAANRPLRHGAKLWPCGSPPRCSRLSPGHSGSSLGSSAFLQTFSRAPHVLCSTRKRWLSWDLSESQQVTVLHPHPFMTFRGDES